MATGREVLAVAHESFALTLYTHWHLEQRRRLTMIAQKSERLDLAGLMAGAYHEPKSLGDRHADFLDSLRPNAAPSGVSARAAIAARQIAVIRAAHASAPDITTLIPS